MKQKNTIIVRLYLSEEEGKMLSKLEDKGERRQELFRSHLRATFAKRFPAYVKPKSEEDEIKDRLTNTEYAERVLGGVVEGNKVIFRDPNKNWGDGIFDLETIKDFTKETLELPWL